MLAVYLLAQLPQLEQSLQHRRESVAAFQPDRTKWLTDDRLVDAIAGVPLNSRMLKVGWDHAILAVDLQGGRPERVREDIGKLILFAYSDISNIKQVLIRVYGERAGSRELLLAAETRKDDWAERDLEELRLPFTGEGMELPDHIRFTLTPQGKRWIANFANS